MIRQCQLACKCLDRVVSLAGLQTEVQHADVPVGQVARGGGMSVAALASTVVVRSGVGGVQNQRQRPQIGCVVESLVRTARRPMCTLVPLARVTGAVRA